MYYLEVEGSFHKIMKGYNSHDGYYNLVEIVKYLIGAVEYSYNIELPKLRHWFLQRCDIAICYDLEENEKVRNYINNLSLCNYPRRNLKHYTDESIYCTGTTTTLKIYNKMLEFKKHDMKKLYNTNFNITEYLQKIDGFVRFECEIKKKKLESIYNKKYIRVISVNYEELKKIWGEEFMKLLNYFESDLTIVRNKEDIERRIYTVYANNENKARILYNFYSSIVLDGIKTVKNRTPRTTYYRNIKELKEMNIDLTQKYTIKAERNTIEFNPFEYKEVV